MGLHRYGRQIPGRSSRKSPGRRRTELAGLPVYSLEVRGTGAAGYACFEMMRGAEVDPLAYLRSTGAPVPPGTTERLGVAPNCYMAYHLMGLR